MTLQYFVTASDTGNRIPIEVDKSTPADLAATKESWQTDWTSEFIGRPRTRKSTRTKNRKNGEIVAVGCLPTKQNPACSFILSTSKATRRATRR